MTKTKAPSKTPSPGGPAKANAQADDKTNNSSSLFISMAVDMGWRLAVVVLVPIIGGYELDQHLDMTPLLTITGFIVAMIGFGLVLWQTFQAANQATQSKGGKS